MGKFMIQALTQRKAQADGGVRPPNEVPSHNQGGRKAPAGFQRCSAALLLVPHKPANCTQEGFCGQ